MYSLIPIALLLFAFHTSAQTLQCVSGIGGCSQGKANQAALQGAIDKFDTSRGYGGQSNIFSSFYSGDTLAQIAYTCQDGSDIPVVSGLEVQKL